ncbi:MAG: NADH-quinone oxidoreductase subunit M [Chloroflexi bacterium]|nr:NADH-quinone oxidoreductase subunit M [Chloroflexota bacterium]
MEDFLANPLNLLIFTPAIGALVVAALPKGQNQLARWTALGLSLIPLMIALGLFFAIQDMQANDGGFYYEYTTEWFPQIGASWHVGVDGVSVAMAILTAILTPLSILIAFENVKNPRAILALILFLETAMLGVFLTLDMVAFFIFWELGLVPMYFIINQWGGENRAYASNKFFIYTMAGSLGLLLSIQLMAFSVGDIAGLDTPTFDIQTWYEQWPGYEGGEDGEILGVNYSNVKYLAFLAFFLAFAIKIPIWPFHTWLPDAHTEAPTAGSMLLAGVLLKQGAYGFIRLVIPLFPDIVAQSYTPVIPVLGTELDFMVLDFATILAFLGMLGIVLGAFAAWAQDDFKKLVAYSSVNHMGFVVVGIAVMAVVYSTVWAIDNEDYVLALDAGNHALVDEDIEEYGDQAAAAYGFSSPATTIEDMTAEQQQLLARYKVEAVLELDTTEEGRHTGTLQDGMVALNGTVLQMFNHGLSAAGMFLLVGALYHKAHTRDLRRFGGLWHTVPAFSALMVFTSMASLGLPGLNGFTGEWLIVAGSFRLFPILILLSMIGLLLTGAYILKGIQKELQGPPNQEWIDYHENEHSLEVNLREMIAMAPLVALMLLTGVYPNWILEVIDSTVSSIFGMV